MIIKGTYVKVRSTAPQRAMYVRLYCTTVILVCLRLVLGNSINSWLYRDTNITGG